MAKKLPSIATDNADLIQGYLDSERRAPATTKQMAASIAKLTKAYRGRRILALTADDVDAFVEDQIDARKTDGSQRHAGTIVKIVDDIRAMFDWAAKQPKYRGRIDPAVVARINVDPSLRHAASSRNSNPRIPPFKWFRSMLDGIPQDTEIGQRDRCALCLPPRPYLEAGSIY